MLSTTQLSQVGNFDQSTINRLGRALGTRESISAAGALSLNNRVSELTVSGTKAYTLAAPDVEGQTKRIVCVAATSVPLGTVTISSPDDTAGFVCSSTFTFTAAGQAIELVATSALKWRCVRVQRAGYTAVTVGTTALTGLNLTCTYGLTVADTVSSTGANALPNGSAVGERCTITCAAVSGSPVGSIDGVFAGMLAYTSYTHLGAIGVAATASVVGDCAVLVWDGSRWFVEYQNGCTLS